MYSKDEVNMHSHATSEVQHREDKHDISQLERTVSDAEDFNKDHIDYDRIDKEVAKYAGATRVEISPEEDKRLKRMIDKRVLSVMIFTYFLQALDKGTMSFSAIMGIREDFNMLESQKVITTIHLYKKFCTDTCFSMLG
jgi:hypothetical protein